MQQIPDSLRTPKQKALAKELLQLTVEHIKVVDNRMVFDMSKNQFRRTGISIEYYRLFKKNMRVNNRYFKKHGIKNVDKMMDEYRCHTRQVLMQKYK